MDTELVKIISLLSEINRKLTNPDTFQAHVFTLTTANKAYQLPYLAIPYSCSVTIKTPSTNSGTIYVGPSEVDVENTGTSLPLIKSESISYKVSNLNAIWVLASAANDKIIWTVEV